METNMIESRWTRGMAGIVVVGLCLAGGWPALGQIGQSPRDVPDYHFLVHPAVPKDGTHPEMDGIGLDAGEIRNNMKGIIEPYWKETSYHTPDKTTGETLNGFYPLTKTYGYAWLPWPTTAGRRPDSFASAFYPTIDTDKDKRMVSFAGEHNWEMGGPEGEPGALFGSTPLIDGYWTPGERFFDSNLNGRWDAEVNVTNTVNDEDRWVAQNKRNTQLGYHSLNGLNWTIGARPFPAHDARRGEIYADYSATSESGSRTVLQDVDSNLVHTVDFNTNVLIYVADPVGRTNKQVYVSEFDLTPGDGIPSTEGDFPHEFVEPGETPLAGERPAGSHADIPVNGKFDYNISGMTGLPLVRRAYHVTLGTPLFVQYERYNNPDGTPYTGSAPAPGSASIVRVPLYQASELFGEVVTPALVILYGLNPPGPGENHYWDTVHPAGGFWPGHHTSAGAFGQWDPGSEVVTFVPAEDFEDFISFWMPLRGLERDGRWVRAVIGTTMHGTTAEAPNLDPEDPASMISYQDYTNYIANNYPGDVDTLVARCGNGVYDGPDNWYNTMNQRMRITGDSTGTTVPKPGTVATVAGNLWDPHGWYGTFEDWWQGVFGSGLPGAMGAYDNASSNGWWEGDAQIRCAPYSTPARTVPPGRYEFVLSNLDTGVTVTNTGDSAADFIATNAGNWVVSRIITNRGVWYPQIGATWDYDGPREFQDLPSSLYHVGGMDNRGSYADDPYACGGDLRLGEVTSPWNNSIAGQDIGSGTPDRAAPFSSGDKVLNPGGPLAYGTHGMYTFDAGNMLNIEVATWRIDGTGFTGPRGPAGSRASGPLAIVEYCGDHRDVNLNGLIDQGETIPAGSHCYFVDDVADPSVSPDGGFTSPMVSSKYPFNWNRYAQDVIEAHDYAEDYKAVQLRDPGQRADTPISLQAPIEGSVGVPVAGPGQRLLAYARGAQRATYLNGDGLWIDLNGDNVFNGDLALGDPSGSLAGNPVGAALPNARWLDVDGNGQVDLDRDLAWIDWNNNGLFDTEIVLADSGQLSPADRGRPVNDVIAAAQVVYRDNGTGPGFDYGDDVWIENWDPMATDGVDNAFDATDRIILQWGAPLTNGTPADGIIPNVYYVSRTAAAVNQPNLGWLPGDDLWVDDGDGYYIGEDVLLYGGQLIYGTPNARALLDGTAGAPLANVYYLDSNNNGYYDARHDARWIDNYGTAGTYETEPVVAQGQLRVGVSADYELLRVYYVDVNGDGRATLADDRVWIDDHDGITSFSDGIYSNQRIPVYFVGMHNNIGIGIDVSGNVFSSPTLDEARPIGGFIQVVPATALGLLSHEQGHDLMGWPDLYDYDKYDPGAHVNYPIGGFDLMSEGGLVHGTPSLKSSVGWIRPTDLTKILPRGGGARTILLFPIETDADQYYYINNPNNPGERIWFWYQANYGAFPGVGEQGLHIQHDDLSGGRARAPQQRFNNHYTWDMVEADGLDEMNDGVNQGNNSDVWPGTTGNRLFTPDTNPASRWWDQSAIGLRILDVRLPTTPLGPMQVDFDYYATEAEWTSPTGGADTDGDGIADAWEIHHFGDIDTVNGTSDFDGDGLSDFDEANVFGTSPTNPDTDGDGIPDGVEVQMAGLSPLNPDDDNDGVPTRMEIMWDGDIAFTPGADLDPRLGDSDGDGVCDLAELAAGSDPLSAAESRGVEIGSIGSDSAGNPVIRWNIHAAVRVNIRYTVEHSENLLNWDYVGNATSEGNAGLPVEITDTGRTGGNGFYRIRLSVVH